MNKKILVFVISLVSILGCLAPLCVYADHGNHKLNGGVGNYGNNRRYYYLDSSCVGIQGKIETAWNDWINTYITTPISVRPTTTKSSSVFDFYFDYTNEQPTLDGWTEYFINPATKIYADTNVSISVGPVCNSNWDWTNIKINAYRYNALPSINPNIDVQKAVIAHEIGHAMGLSHSADDSLSLMRRRTTDFYVDKCTAKDLTDINTLYKN